MKKILFTLLAFLIIYNTYCQNPFPDPLEGSYRSTPPPITQLGEEFLPTPLSLSLTLPTYVFNNTSPHFPNILNQQTGVNSCVQVAEIGYVFTYELNRKRGLEAGNGTLGNTQNLYNYLYTYNFLNQSNPTSFTNYGSGFSIANKNGIPSYDDFYDEAINEPVNRYKYWMTSFEKYFSAMHNSIKPLNKIFYFNSSIPGGLNSLKHWIADHSTGSDDGGIAIIGVIPNGWQFMNISNGQYIGDTYIYSLGNCAPGEECGHALTIVGYDDSIPTFGDEIGAFKVANSMGIEWMNDGYVWLPYYLLYPTNPGLQFDYAYSCDAYSDPNETIPEPLLAVKTTITHIDRNEIKLSVAAGVNANSGVPNEFDFKTFSCFDYQGGNHSMRGCYDGPLELGLNFGRYFESFGKIFLKVSQDNYGNSGIINTFSIFDHRWGVDFELAYNYTDIKIQPGSNVISIEYHLLPHEEPMIGIHRLSSNRVSRFNPEVSGVQSSLIIEPNIKLDMYNSQLTIHNGSSLTLNPKAKIVAKSGQSKLLLNGIYYPQSGAEFIAENNSELEIDFNGSTIELNQEIKFIADGGILKININNGLRKIQNGVQFIAQNSGKIEVHFNDANDFLISDAEFKSINDGKIDIFFENDQSSVIIKESTFENTRIVSSAGNFTFQNCSISSYNGYLSCLNGNILISNSSFNNTGIFLRNYSGDQFEYTTIHGCTLINNSLNIEAIVIAFYGEYAIYDNLIEGYQDGVYLFNAGKGRAGTIDNNIIHSCNDNGLIAYNSIGKIYENNIYDNYYGVRFMNNCSFSLSGDPNAQTFEQTQQINQNSSIDVYASEFSFPWYFRYNRINDPDNNGNPNDPLVEWDRPQMAYPVKVDIALNNWGTGFDASDDLYGNNVDFLVTPIWYIPVGLPLPSPDEDLYRTALINFDTGNYVVAKNQYQLLIDMYPKSIFAEASMKDLLRIEELTGKDFRSLQEYYAINDSIQGNPILEKLSRVLINDCNVRLENFPDAIEWYESRIEQSENAADSIFAIIDLGYVYILMENEGLKLNYRGRFPEYIPRDEKEFFTKQKSLLTLLPTHKYHNVLSYRTMDMLSQNYPNPSHSKTSLQYLLEKEGIVTIKLIDESGKIIRIIEEGKKNIGTHRVEFDLSTLSVGIYFYTLFIDDELKCSKKMNIVK